MALTNESIYDLIPKVFKEPEKGLRYTSKFKKDVKTETHNNKAQYKTMGPSKVATRPTNDFLKCHEKEPKLPKESNFKYEDEERRKPAVPKKDDKPVMGIRTNKNFITQNAMQNIMSVPRKPDKNFVDTRHGDKQQLEPSGMEPKHIHKKDYGKTPEYLVKRQEEIKKAQQEYDEYIAENFRKGAMKSLGDQEREKIIEGLKSNWEQLHHEYQGLSVVTDTAPKKNRKERMEAEMKQLERDIELIEKHKIIYIAN